MVAHGGPRACRDREVAVGQAGWPGAPQAGLAAAGNEMICAPDAMMMLCPR
jgi:hypothetical protein